MPDEETAHKKGDHVRDLEKQNRELTERLQDMLGEKRQEDHAWRDKTTKALDLLATKIESISTTTDNLQEKMDKVVHTLTGGMEHPEKGVIFRVTAMETCQEEHRKIWARITVGLIATVGLIVADAISRISSWKGTPHP